MERSVDRQLKLSRMPLSANRLHASLSTLAVILSTSAAQAQRTPRPTERATPPAILNPGYDSSLYTSPTATSSRFKALKWRLVGPFRGGRVDAVAGDPSKPLVFYFGAVNGGFVNGLIGMADYEDTSESSTVFGVSGGWQFPLGAATRA